MAFLYIISEREEGDIRNSIPFTITPKKINYLGINFTKEVKDLYKENYKTLLQETKDTRIPRHIPIPLTERINIIKMKIHHKAI